MSKPSLLRLRETTILQEPPRVTAGTVLIRKIG